MEDLNAGLSDGQFREHLDEFHRQLGLEFGPNSLTLPGGMRLPTVRQSVDVVGTPGGVQHNLYAHVPAESGHIHGLTANLYAGTSRMNSGITFRAQNAPAQGGSTWWLPDTSDRELEPGSEHADPVAFQNRVQEIMRNPPHITPEARQENLGWMQKWQGKSSGGIDVRHEPVWNKSGNRYYHFQVGTGRLTAR